MPRHVPERLGQHLASGAPTVCGILKIVPALGSQSAPFGLSSLDDDIVYDDGKGAITYKEKYGFNLFDIATSADLSVGNTEAHGLIATHEADGVTKAAIARGDYDSAEFVLYLVNYMDLTMGHVELLSGQVGPIEVTDDDMFVMQLRTLTQILQQATMIEQTSITDRAAYGDARNKMPLYYYASSVSAVGAESDRTFTAATIPGFDDAFGSSRGTVTDVQFFVGNGVTSTVQLLDSAGAPVTSGFVLTGIKLNGVATSGYTVSSTGMVTFDTAPPTGAAATWSGTQSLYPAGYFVPGLIRWTSGSNSGRENELESYDRVTGNITLKFATRDTIAIGDTFTIRRDSNRSKTQAIADNNLNNMRAEPDLPRGDSMYLQSPSAT